MMAASTFEGHWRSGNGAEVHLVQYGEAISGTYTAEAAQPVAACRGRVLVGTAEGNIIGFVTSCPAPHMIKSWTGRLVQSDGLPAPKLHTVCHTVDRISQELEMARSLTLETVVFTKIIGDHQSNSRLAQ